MSIQFMSFRISNDNSGMPEGHKLPNTRTTISAPPKKGKKSVVPKARPRPRIIGSGSHLPRTGSETAQEILYHRLLVTMPSPMQFKFSYDGQSGIVKNNDINAFMNTLMNGQVPSVTRYLYNSANDAPNIVLKYPCYVIIQLVGDPTIVFKSNSEAIDTQDDFSSNDKYCNLDHYDTSWDMSEDTSTLDPCYFVRFDVQDVDPMTHSPLINDQFNLNLQIGSSGGPPIFFTVDPALKNRGPGGMVSTNAL